MATLYKIFCTLLLVGLTIGHTVGWSVTSLVQSDSPTASHSTNATHK